MFSQRLSKTHPARWSVPIFVNKHAFVGDQDASKTRKQRKAKKTEEKMQLQNIPFPERICPKPSLTVPFGLGKNAIRRAFVYPRAPSLVTEIVYIQSYRQTGFFFQEEEGKPKVKED